MATSDGGLVAKEVAALIFGEVLHVVRTGSSIALLVVMVRSELRWWYQLCHLNGGIATRTDEPLPMFSEMPHHLL